MTLSDGRKSSCALRPCSGPIRARKSSMTEVPITLCPNVKSESTQSFTESLSIKTVGFCLERETVLSLFDTGLRASLPAILLTWRIGQDDFTEFNQQQTSWVNSLVPLTPLNRRHPE
jgi:hypothetical protein